jgi:hypothetical protein
MVEDNSGDLSSWLWLRRTCCFMTVCHGQEMLGPRHVIATLLLPQGKTKDKQKVYYESTKEF